MHGEVRGSCYEQEATALQGLTVTSNAEPKHARQPPRLGAQLLGTVKRAVFGVGLLATGRALVRQIAKTDRAGGSLPRKPTGPHPFDQEFGVDTGGFLSWRDLQTGSANDPYTSGYLGVAPTIARRVIGLVREPERYTFVDIGCGKGRPLIVASELPFRRIVGVEIAPEIAEAARRNAEAIRARFPERTPIEVVTADATTFEFPDGPVVLFMYQPFEIPVMRVVVRRLAESLARAPREAVVLYVNPVHARALDRIDVLERAAEGHLEPAREEVPYGYAGRGGAHDAVAWRTREPRPALGSLA
jgi:SAM-dependent methyltransferase